MSNSTRISPRATPYVELTPADNNAPADGSSSNNVKARIIGSNGQAMLDQNYPVKLNITRGSAVFRDTGANDIATFIDPSNNGYTPLIALADTVAESVIVNGSVFFPGGVQPGNQAFNFAAAPTATYEIVFGRVDQISGNGTTPADGKSVIRLGATVMKNGMPAPSGVAILFEAIQWGSSDVVFFSPSATKSTTASTNGDGYVEVALYGVDISGALPVATVKAQADISRNTVAYQLVGFSSPNLGDASVTVTAQPNPASAGSATPCTVAASLLPRPPYANGSFAALRALPDSRAQIQSDNTYFSPDHAVVQFRVTDPVAERVDLMLVASAWNEQGTRRLSIASPLSVVFT